MPAPAPSAAARTISAHTRSGSLVGDEPAPIVRGPDYPGDLYAEVAAATGHDLDTIRIRDIGWCRRNPRGRGDEFDQSLPADFEHEVVRANIADAANSPAGLIVDYRRPGHDEPYRSGVDLDRAYRGRPGLFEARAALIAEGEYETEDDGEPAVLRIAPRTGPSAAAKLRESAALATAQRERPFGEPPTIDRRLPLSVRRDAVRGGVAIVCRLGFRDILVSPPLADAEADALEPAYRAAAEAFRRAAPADLPLAG